MLEIKLTASAISQDANGLISCVGLVYEVIGGRVDGGTIKAITNFTTPLSPEEFAKHFSFVRETITSDIKQTLTALEK